jgi:hypothetical protein
VAGTDGEARRDATPLGTRQPVSLRDFTTGPIAFAKLVHGRASSARQRVPPGFRKRHPAGSLGGAYEHRPRCLRAGTGERSGVLFEPTAAGASQRKRKYSSEWSVRAALTITEDID